MSVLLATLAVRPVRILLPQEEGLLKIEIGEEVSAEELAQRPVAEVGFSHVQPCKGSVSFKRISASRNILLCHGCYMRIPVPAEIETIGELVRHMDALRRKERSPI